MGVHVKQEVLDSFVLASQRRAQNQPSTAPIGVIDLSSSESSVSRDSDDEGEGEGEDAALGKRPRVPEGNETASSSGKKRKVGDASRVVLPVGFLDPIVPDSPLALPTLPPAVSSPSVGAGKQRSSESRGATCKQFWKAGDYVGAPSGDWDLQTGGMDHVRVHPKFLHSNATSHKWALGAFAELLDNALDEVCNGATYANLDMLLNKKDGNRMLLIEDNGGGMDPDKMRQCLSLGYSAKSKLANTIGQYGNGFKTSTMRLGADVIVFSRCRGKSGRRPTQSIGLLSYTFLRSTGKEDIVVPILDYERKGDEWEKMIRPSPGDWSRNVETIVQWSPFSSEANLLQQFNLMKDHGTRIIIFNLWEDDQGHLELDFDSDPSDIQIRGVNRDEKNIQMAKEFPNSRHFLTYRHSLRSYVSILYLRLPPIFRIILRGKDVEHHNIVNDMMMSTKITYRPQAGAENTQDRDPNLVAVVTIGFVKDAESHIDVQGFNVYHKNRLIKPFWRVWNAAGSDGRGVIGVLEANFVEPAHDKQGFERTTVLARLETKLLQLQKTYWTSNCHLIGYAPRGRNRKEMTDDPEYLAEKSPDCVPNVNASSRTKRKSGLDNSGKIYSKGKASGSRQNGVSRLYSKGESGTKVFNKFSRRSGSEEQPSPCSSGHSDDAVLEMHERRVNENSSERLKTSGIHCFQTALPEDGVSEAGHSLSLDSQNLLDKLKEENQQLKERLNKEQDIFGDLQCELQSERDKCKQLEMKMTTAIAIEDVRREVKILKALAGHSNLVRFYEAYEDSDNVYIVMELCQGGELLDRLLSRGGNYTEDNAKDVMLQILNVVAFCHLQGVVHRDLKPENFLFSTNDEDSQLKAIDFGLSDFVKPDEKLNDIVGSAYYVAPEVLHRSYSTEADVWSIGVIAYILLCGSRPFWARTESGIFRAVLKADPNFDEPPWPSLSSEAKDFVKRMLNKDPRRRMTAAQAICHPWLRNYKQAKVPLDILIFKLMKSYLRSSSLRRAALRALSRTLTVDELCYLKEQYALLQPSRLGTISLENIKEALLRNGTDAMKESRAHEYSIALNALQFRRMDFEEFCAAASSVHQLEALDRWEQHARCAYELFEKDGNRAIMIEELASELGLSPNVPVHAVLHDWIRHTDGKLSFLGFIKLVHGASSRLPAKPH